MTTGRGAIEHGASDVLIVGAGPAGAIAGLVAARHGARVRLVDRAAFPRDKLCGDTVNPGAMAMLRRLGVAAAVEAIGLPVAGMTMTGENGARVEGRYPSGLRGRAVMRRDLDRILLNAALAAGCQFDEGVAVRRAVIRETASGSRVIGVAVAGRDGERQLTAPVVIGADGRRSTLAFGLGLARHPERPRRWAVGAYFHGVGCPSDVRLPSQTSQSDFDVRLRSQTPMSDSDVRLRSQTSKSDLEVGLGSQTWVEEIDVVGEMHVRRNCYIGVAPVPGGLTNVCLVQPSRGGDAEFRHPADLLSLTLKSDSQLRHRFADARLAAPPVVLGPLAVDAVGPPLDGLLLAGDAAGFIDPMTGDGLRFAVRGGELAALAALQALEHGWTDVHDDYAGARRDAFGGKWRFNRAVRAFVSSSRAVTAAAAGARLAPGVLRALIARAGDCDLAA